jgi:hypothetical protein
MGLFCYSACRGVLWRLVLTIEALAWIGWDWPVCTIKIAPHHRTGAAVGRTSGARVLPSSLEFIWADQKVSRNLPCLGDLVDHVDCKGRPAGENFRCTRSRVQ